MRKYERDPESIPADEYDALLITEWLAHREYSPMLPKSADLEYNWAHENPDAWPLVDLPTGMGLSEAKTLMATRATFTRSLRFNENHDELGRFTSGDSVGAAGGGAATIAKRPVGQAISSREASDLYKDVHNQGGFTYDTKTATYQTDGYAVSPYLASSQTVPFSEFSPEHVSGYADAQAGLLSRADHYMGAWHDTESGNVYLDVSVVKATQAEAVTVAQLHNQIAIFDLKNGTEIATGGTGRSLRSLEPSGLERSVEVHPGACQACEDNSDPENVPVHPGCHCDILTDSVDTGVDPGDMADLADQFGDSEVVPVGVDSMPDEVEFLCETASVFDASGFRFGDLMAWSEAQELSGVDFNVMFADDQQTVVCRAAATAAATIGIRLNKNNAQRSAGTNARLILTRANATPDELANAFRIIIEGQQ